MEMASSSTDRQNQTQAEDDFGRLAIYSASTSTEPYDIFINCHQGYVKHTLATIIYQKLHSMGFRVFLDVEALEPGDSIREEVHHAITSAALQLAIFSPNYAESPRCLAELSFMLKTGAKIIPIFFHVEPSDLRWIEQRQGMYAVAFSEHEKEDRYTPEKLDEWKRALCDISIRSGYLVNNNGGEARVLRDVVKCAFQVMKRVPLTVAEHLLGLDELVEDFQSIASEEKVKITGIVGMGGSGKTTLAKELFNRNFSSFERSSFVSDVRDAASRNALPAKQNRLLEDLGVHHLPFDNVDEGKAALAIHLSSLRALIVLDDVDHIDHLNALLPNKENLGSQSMVIVTTRELGALKSWGLSPSCIYKMRGLGLSHAVQLFCWHAFLQPFPPRGFETLVQKFIQACNGLPLSLKVLGAQLCGNYSVDYWESQSNKISRILPTDIKGRLHISYAALDEEEKEMFLDVACFLIGETKSIAIAVWDGMHWSGLHGLETLVNKCLVELVHEPDYHWTQGGYPEWSDKIMMHDHLRDMGREIASGQSSYRLWCPEQIVNIKEHFTRSMLIRGIRPTDAFVAFKEYTHQLMGNSRRGSKCLRFSNGLQILSVEGNEFTEELAILSEDLVWLRWEDFRLRNLPSWLTIKRLSVLELHSANELEELWEDNVEPPLQLREFIISGNEKLQWLPSSIGRLQYLKKLDFSFHGSSLPEEFSDLQLLEYLALSSTVLSSLPAGFGNLLSLRSLYLTDCSQLSMLPYSFQQLIQLEYLNLSGCEMLYSLPAGFGNLISLQNLNLGYCRQLMMLPDSFEQLMQLKELNLSDCESLSSLPAGFGKLRSLRYLNLGYCRQLRMLPDSLQQLIHLEELNLLGCELLSSLPAGFGNLRSLRNLNLGYCRQLKMLPNSFQQLIRLENLNLSGSELVYSLPASSGNFANLRIVNLDSCSQLSTLPADSKRSLQVSYDQVDEKEKEMFLDLACFLNGEKKSRAIAVWDGSGWNGLYGLEILMKKCLVELVDDPDYNGEKIIRMHDHVRDMGREIASRHSPYRFWYLEQIVDFVKLNKHSTERKLIRGILPADAFVAFKEYMHQSMGESSGGSQHLRFSTGLQILSVEGNEFTEEFASLSEDLVWLRWEGFPLRNLPPWLTLRNLSVLELHGANELEELWKDKEHAPLQLRELTITGTWSASFERFPSSISNLKHLKKIALLGDVGKEFGIEELPEEFCDLQSLEQLELRHCTLLSSIPARFGDLRNLRHLDMCSCKELRILPDSFNQLAHLQYLDLSGCKKLAFQIDILKSIKQLKNLYLSGCLKLRQLPHQITDQACLRELRLQDTRLEDVPTNIGHLSKLELVTIGSPFLTSLPVSLGDMSSLKSLSIIDCIDLESLPETLGCLTLLEHLCIESSGVKSLPDGLTKLANLRTLKISGCPISELNFGSGSSFPLRNLRDIEISETRVARISITEDCCPRLEKLNISRNDYLEEIETLPTTVKNIEWSECERLKSIEYKGKKPIVPWQEVGCSLDTLLKNICHPK